MLAPSNSGKTNLLVHMITNIYAGKFTAGVHVISNSINIDDAWIPVRRYIEEQGFEPSKYLHEGYDDELMGKLLSEQKQVIEYQKKKGQGGKNTPFTGSSFAWMMSLTMPKSCEGPRIWSFCSSGPDIWRFLLLSVYKS